MSNISKDNNQFQMGVNTIQQKTNRFWEYYSNFLIRYSWLILILSSVITIGLSICFIFFMQIRQFDQTDFLIQNGPALTNARRIQSIFGNDKDYRVHQQIELYPALDVIIKRKLQSDQNDKNLTNMLTNQIIDEV
jgi:hypothetical protein